MLRYYTLLLHYYHHYYYYISHRLRCRLRRRLPRSASSACGRWPTINIYIYIYIYIYRDIHTHIIIIIITWLLLLLVVVLVLVLVLLLEILFSTFFKSVERSYFSAIPFVLTPLVYIPQKGGAVETGCSDLYDVIY